MHTFLNKDFVTWKIANYSIRYRMTFKIYAEELRASKMGGMEDEYSYSQQISLNI